AQTVIVLENDVYRRADAEEVSAFFDGARHIVALDHLRNRTTAKAEVVLPAGTFAETDGTLVNYELRAQRFFEAVPPTGEVQASWRWLGGALIPDTSAERRNWRTLDEIVSAVAKEIRVLAPIERAA